MNITLKQADIEKAVRLYIERQGFHLLNKTLSIDFSMGRGENGLSAILTIEDAVTIPGYTDQTDPVAGISAGPSAAVQALAAAVSLPATETVKPTQPEGLTKRAADQVILPGGGEVKPMLKAAADPDPVAVVVDEVVEVAKVAPATLAEVAEAGIAVAAVATQETEAAAAAPVAEAKVAEAAPAPVAEAQAKPTTSLFG
jgi:hypothetical protein